MEQTAKLSLFTGSIWMDAAVGNTFDIPVQAVHRAFGGPGDLLIIEVQQGAILLESDIERLEDDFGRVIP